MYAVTLIKEIFTIVIHPDGGFIDPRESENRIFVCGSLMDPEFVASLLGHGIAACPAVAAGFSRAWGESGGKKMHFLRRDAAGFVPGVALLGLSAADVAKLEVFEQAPAVRRGESLMLRIGDMELEGFTYLKND
jgi:hypothetical protein